MPWVYVLFILFVGHNALSQGASQGGNPNLMLAVERALSNAVCATKNGVMHCDATGPTGSGATTSSATPPTSAQLNCSVIPPAQEPTTSLGSAATWTNQDPFVLQSLSSSYQNQVLQVANSSVSNGTTMMLMLGPLDLATASGQSSAAFYFNGVSISLTTSPCSVMYVNPSTITPSAHPSISMVPSSSFDNQSQVFTLTAAKATNYSSAGYTLDCQTLQGTGVYIWTGSVCVNPSTGSVYLETNRANTKKDVCQWTPVGFS